MVVRASVSCAEEAQEIPVLFPLGFSVQKKLRFIDFCFDEQTRLPVWSVILCEIQTSICRFVDFFFMNRRSLSKSHVESCKCFTTRHSTCLQNST
jgi:hypothetical protein